MEIIFEFLFSVLGEFLLQVLGEAFLNVGLHALAEPFRKQPQPWLAAVGYLVFGAVIGGLSLLVYPDYLVASKGLRVANAALSPIAAGLCMAAVGKWPLGSYASGLQASQSLAASAHHLKHGPVVS